MSTTTPWGRIGAWAADAEAAEAEEREAAEAAAAAAAAIPKLAAESHQSFPSLKEAAAAKPKKKKATMSLSVFTTGRDVGPGGGARQPYPSHSEPKGLTPDELLRLPTGPKERTPEELEYGRLGGGFRSYGLGGGGRSGGSGMHGRRDDGDSSWGQGGGGRRPYGGGFDEEQRRGPTQSMVSDFEQMPSRADEVDNWASEKKSFAPPIDSRRQDRYQALGSGVGESRADEVDNWSMGKKLLPSRYSGVGSGFRDSSAPSDSDRWVRGGGGAGPLPQNGDRERPRLVLDPPKGEVGVLSEPVRTRPSPFAAARPREEVLTEKGVDWRKVDSEIEIKKTSRPTSSHSSRPSSAHSSRAESPAPQLTAAEGAPRPRQKVNPFGDAKPREILLQEKGKDWKKIDFELEHRGVDRPETEQERMLKEEINRVKKLLAKKTEANHNGESVQYSAEELDSLRQLKDNMDRELELLTRELDDKVRFGQRSTSDRRLGSGSGRLTVFPDRPPSQSGMSEESRSMEFMERPRSRGGMGDMWTRPVDDRRPFQLSREGGFLGNRNMDRSRSRERW